MLMLTGCGGVEGHTEEGDPSSSGLTVTFIDVGKGDCILIEMAGKAVMIDAGYDDTADDVLAVLSDRKIDTLDALIITHYDKDHVGGAAAMVKALKIRSVYLPAYTGSGKHYNALMAALEAAEISAVKVTKDEPLSLAGAELKIYATTVDYISDDGDEEGNDNDVSLVIDMKYGEDSYLFAGDIEKEGIKAYLAAGHGHYDVLKVPHHGNKAGNSDELVASVSPKIAVITDSKEEEAEKKLLNLLEEAGAAIYRTSELGTFSITSRGRGEYTLQE